MSAERVTWQEKNSVSKNQSLYILMFIKIQPDATVCRYLFTARSLYMFRVSQHPSSGVLKTVTVASGTGHNIGTATSLQRGLIRTGLCEPCGKYSEATVTVFSAPDGGCGEHTKRVE